MTFWEQFEKKIESYAKQKGMILKEEMIEIPHKAIAIQKAWSNAHNCAVLIYISVGPGDIRTIQHYLFQDYETYVEPTRPQD